jgi:general secretion pathway protein E/type IV pilus assembly protein PilB
MKRDHTGALSLTAPEEWVMDPAAVAMLDATLARQHAVLPLGFDSRQHQLHLAVTRPQDSLTREALRAGINDNCGVCWHTATDAVVAEGLQRCYGQSHWSTRVQLTDEDTHIVRLVDNVLYQAVAAGASDVHISPQADDVRVRIRCDGKLEPLVTLDAQWADSIAIRLKVMATLDVAESRRPQDGRFQRLVCARPVDMRVSSFPFMYGENIVVRLHDGERQSGELASLGLDANTLQDVQALLQSPPGLTVVCGPTGSGKTTTLYAMLNALDDGSRSLMTLEDPVEHPLAGVVQASVDPSRAIDFASGARALLRQDPDVLMIGEIRDHASCRVAVRAALSGVRVFGTVHAADCCLAIERLLELGATPSELAAMLSGVVAQRLVRRRHEAGRLALFEVLLCTAAVRTAILEELTPEQIAAIGFTDRGRLSQQALQAEQSGMLDEQEVRRVFGVRPDDLIDPQLTRRRKDAHFSRHKATG